MVKRPFFGSRRRILWSSLGLLALCALLVAAGAFATASASAAAPNTHAKSVLKVNPTAMGVPNLGSAHDCASSTKAAMICKVTLSAPKSNRATLKWHYTVTQSDGTNLTATTTITPDTRKLAHGQHIALTITFGKFECSEGASSFGTVNFISAQSTATLTIACG